MTLHRKFTIGFVAIAAVAVFLAVGVRLLGKAAKFHYLEREHLALITSVQNSLALIEEGGPRSDKVSREEVLAAITEARRIAGSVDAELFGVEIAAFRLFGFSAVIDLPAEAFKLLTRIQATVAKETSPTVSRDLESRIKDDMLECRRKGDQFGPLVYDASRFVQTLVLLINLLAVAVIVTVFILIRRATLRPIQQAVLFAKQIADGDLSAPRLPRPPDEMGQLLSAFDEMKHNLSNVVGQVRERSLTVATCMSQVASGSEDLSARTERQAATLQEAAANISELRLVAKQIEDQVRTADSQAVAAGAIASEGGHAVSMVVSRMDATLDASRRIADINGVIDGIAFQTNVLALNAAVEAARAGTAGRGFGVVAGEVRSLAKRSASAAREIAQLVGDTTERVEVGAVDVGKAGQAINRTVASVGQVAQLVSAVAIQVSNQEVRIVQIDESMRELDRGTQHNAAMAEQSAAAAASAVEQAHLLVQAVDRFKLA